MLSLFIMYFIYPFYIYLLIVDWIPDVIIYTHNKLAGKSVFGQFRASWPGQSIFPAQTNHNLFILGSSGGQEKGVFRDFRQPPNTPEKRGTVQRTF